MRGREKKRIVLRPPWTAAIPDLFLPPLAAFLATAAWFLLGPDIDMPLFAECAAILGAAVAVADIAFRMSRRIIVARDGIMLEGLLKSVPLRFDDMECWDMLLDPKSMPGLLGGLSRGLWLDGWAERMGWGTLAIRMKDGTINEIPGFTGKSASIIRDAGLRHEFGDDWKRKAAGMEGGSARLGRRDWHGGAGRMEEDGKPHDCVVLRPAGTAFVSLLLGMAAMLFLVFFFFPWLDDGLDMPPLGKAWMASVVIVACVFLALRRMSARLMLRKGNPEIGEEGDILRQDALVADVMGNRTMFLFADMDSCVCLPGRMDSGSRETSLAEFLWPLGLSDWALEKGWGNLIVVRKGGGTAHFPGFTPKDAALIREELEKSRERSENAEMLQRSPE